MKTSNTSMLLASLIAAIGLTTATLAVPQQPDSAQQETEKGQSFHGKVDSIDPAAQTLLVSSAMIYVTPTTVFSKDGKTITLSDIKVGDEVHGKTRTSPDGKTEALTVEVGPKARDVK